MVIIDIASASVGLGRRVSTSLLTGKFAPGDGSHISTLASVGRTRARPRARTRSECENARSGPVPAAARSDPLYWPLEGDVRAFAGWVGVCGVLTACGG